MSSRRKRREHPYHSEHSSYSPQPSIRPVVGYVLEWTANSKQRHGIATTEALRSELLAGDWAGGERLLVLHGKLHRESEDVLRDLAGVDGKFLQAHDIERAYRPMGRRRTARWWCWKYPEFNMNAKGPTSTENGASHEGNTVSLRRVSLWMSSGVPILLVEQLSGLQDSKPQAPTLKHQDAETRRSALQQAGGRYGAIGHSAHRPDAQTGDQTDNGIDDDLWNFVEAGTHDVPLEDVLAEVVHERWASFLRDLRVDEEYTMQRGGSNAFLWTSIMALEQNLDDARYHSRQGRYIECVSATTWADFIQRTHLRLQLVPPFRSSISRRARDQCHQSDIEPGEGKDYEGLHTKSVNERSLDRIAYLGGLLLPISVVASILAIEGRYGPGGSHFWVFWIASLVTSIIALLFIYLDQLRLLEVWIEEPGVLKGVDANGLAERVGGAVNKSGGASKATDRAYAWRREQLGWKGAVKTATGWYRWRGTGRMTFRKPVYDSDLQQRVDERNSRFLGH